MGIENCNPSKLTRLNVDEILTNINRLFTGMLIRGSDVRQIKEKIRSKIQSGNLQDIEGWKYFMNQEIYNSEFGKTIQALVSAAMQDAKANYNDQTLPLLCLLFLSNSDPNTFINCFKAINLAKRAIQVGSNIQNMANMYPGNFSPQGFMNFAQGANNVMNNFGGAFHQAQNPDMIQTSDLKNLMSYYINFLTLLPVNLLSQFGEGVPMKSYFVTVLNNAFNKNVQSNFVNSKLFSGYEGRNEISVDEFFDRNYIILKNDNQLRKDFVSNYVNNLKPTDIIKLMAK